jgi:chromate transporter
LKLKREEADNKNRQLWELSKLFFKLGVIAFGGPAAHIAMFEDEVVAKRQWLSRQHFLDLVGATNLIPGPNSTEMAIHIGYQKGKVPGALISGISFMFTSVLLTGILAYFYFLYGNLPSFQPFLYGIKPAVIIIILNAVYKLGMKAVKGHSGKSVNIKLVLIALIVALLNFYGLNEIYSLLIGGIAGALFLLLFERKDKVISIFPAILISLFSLKPVLQAIEKTDVSLIKLFLTFLKIGAVWFGGGYILVAYFNGELVQGLHWLTRKELLDAIAVSQLTPGPLLSSATFIGYQIAGVSGAILATVGIVLPSFVFVLILNPLVPRMRKSDYLSKFLDAVNVSALAVMFVVAAKLGVEVMFNPVTGFVWQAALIAFFSAGAFLFIRKVNSAYVVLGGAALGYLFYLI